MGLRAAAASLAIIGDIIPLLAEIFSMIEKEEGVVDTDTASPDKLQLCVTRS